MSRGNPNNSVSIKRHSPMAAARPTNPKPDQDPSVTNDHFEHIASLRVESHTNPNFAGAHRGFSRDWLTTQVGKPFKTVSRTPDPLHPG